MLVIDGGAVKSQEDGVAIGQGIVFGSPNDPDQSKERDFFTAESFIMGKDKFEVPLYHNHGFPVKVQIGEAVLTKTDNGWDAEAKINLSNELGKQVYETMKTVPYGFSTGAMTHLVEREAKENNTNFLKTWVVGELSLTPRPAERKAVVQAIKSLDGEEVVYEDLKVAPTQEEMDNSVTVAFYEKDGEGVWEPSSSVPMPEWAKDSKNIEKGTFKYISTSGSVTYDFSTYDSEAETYTDIVMYQYGGAEDLISTMQNILNTAAAAVKGKTEEELTLEDKVQKIVKNMLPEKTDNTEISELKTQLQDAKDKLAEAEQKFSESETNLTEATEKIARLEILAGANDTIKNKR